MKKEIKKEINSDIYNKWMYSQLNPNKVKKNMLNNLYKKILRNLNNKKIKKKQ